MAKDAADGSGNAMRNIAEPSRSHRAREGGRASGEYRRRLVWLMAVRTLVISVVLGLSLWLSTRTSEPKSGATTLILMLIVVTYVTTVVSARLLQRGIEPETLAWPQLAGDLVITTLLVYVTGAAQSAYSFFFALSIVAAGALKYRRGVIIVGAVSLMLMAAIALLGWTHAVPVPIIPMVHPADQTATDFLRTLGQNEAAIIAVGVLSYVLGDQLQRTTQSLATERQTVADLVTLHQDIIRSLSSGLITIDLEGRVLTANHAAEEILGVPLSALTGQRIADVMPGIGNKLAAVAANDSLRRGDMIVNRGDEELVLGISFSPLRNVSEAVVGRVINFQDLTELRQMEQSLRRTERMATLGQLAAAVAHEIRNPLAAISGSIELLRQAPPTSEDDRALMTIVNREADRLNTLITELLDYANPRPQQPAELDLAQLVDETVRVFRQDRGFANVRIDSPGQRVATIIHGDPEKLRQVLWNLLRNAAEATTDRSGTVSVEIVRDEAMAGFVVRDSGPGISAEMMPRIFEPFFTTKKRGTGLGLATCHSIVHDHGGTIEAANNDTGGAGFTVWLPTT